MNKLSESEVLNLIINENSESAFEELSRRYRPLFLSRLRKFKIKQTNFDDYYQECLITLNDCCKKYDSKKQKTFASYLDMSIQHKIRNLLRSDHNYFYNVILADYEDLETYNYKTNEKSNLLELSEEEVKSFTPLEKDVYELLKENKSIKEISLLLNKPIKSIYNTITRVKEKTKHALSERINNSKSIFITSQDKVKLSSLEKKVMELYIQGYKPMVIAKELNFENDKVYNALKRALKKVKLLEKKIDK